MGFKRCYLETTAFLKEAIALYEHLGFEHIDYALGCTGHVDCEVRMLRNFENARELRLAGIQALTTYFLSMLDVT